MSYQDIFWNLLVAEWSISDIAEGYGLTERGVWRILGVPATTETLKTKPAELRLAA